ncbi:MAG: hypothetical protein E7191_06580 [Erysipelotrichaceae bacterium]|nr:hypothetical protein [Erysipelotrichaceae bacterium]
MRMFKKFVDFFLEDDEEVTTEEVQEEQTETVVVHKPMADISLEPKVEEEKKVESSKKMEFYEVAGKPSRFIDLEDEPVRKEKKKVEPVSPRKNEYEFTSVISPIFGVRDSGAPKASTSTVTSRVEVEESVLGTVFSPMYGRATKKVSKEVKLQESVVEEPIQKEDTLPPMFELDDLLSLEKKLNHEVESHQFSLFDDYVQEETEDHSLENDLSEFFDYDNK